MKKLLLALFLLNSNNCLSNTIYLSYKKIFNVVWNDINSIPEPELKSHAYYLWMIRMQEAVQEITDNYKAEEIINLDEFKNIGDIDLKPDVTNEIIKLMKVQNGQ